MPHILSKIQIPLIKSMLRLFNSPRPSILRGGLFFCFIFLFHSVASVISHMFFKMIRYSGIYARHPAGCFQFTRTPTTVFPIKKKRLQCDLLITLEHYSPIFAEMVSYWYHLGNIIYNYVVQSPLFKGFFKI